MDISNFNFPQHLLPVLLLNTAFFGFLQYVDRVYKDALKEIEEKIRDSKFDPNDGKEEDNRSEIYRKIKKHYEELRNPIKANNHTLNIAYIGVYIGTMVMYFLYLISWFFPSYFNMLNYIWIMGLAIGTLALFIIIYMAKIKAEEMKNQVDSLRTQKKEFLDLLVAYQTDKKVKLI